MGFRLKSHTLFPALVSVAAPLTLIKNGLSYAFGIDVAALVASVTASLTGETISGNLSVDGTIGYATGSGGAVTQITSKTTTVVLSESCGKITMIGTGDIAADTTVSFTLTNTLIAATDVLVLNHLSGGAPGSVHLNAQCGAGSAIINVRNVTPSVMTAPAPVITFVLIKGVIT